MGFGRGHVSVLVVRYRVSSKLIHYQTYLWSRPCSLASARTLAITGMTSLSVVTLPS